MTFGDILKTFTVTDWDAGMLDFDGQHFYMANYFGSVVNINKIAIFDRAWKLLKTYDMEADGGGPLSAYHNITGIQVCGAFIYILAEATKLGELAEIYLLARQNFCLLKKWEIDMSPSNTCDGLFIQGNFIRLVDYDAYQLATYDRQTMARIDAWDIGQYDSEDIAFDGRCIYLSSGWGETEIGKYDLKGNLLKLVDMGVETWGITFDGKDLYVSRYDAGLIHKVSRV